MLAHEIMTTPVVTAAPDMPVTDAIRLLDKHDITALPVLDGNDRLIGIVSEADLLRGRIARDPRSQVQPFQEAIDDAEATVAAVMTPGVLAVHESTDTSDIARLMLDTGVKSVPVTRGQRVVGIVSRRDLIRALASDDQQIEDAIHALFTEASLTEWSVKVLDGQVRLIGDGPASEARVAAILARTVAGVGRVHAPGDAERVELPREAR
jgi:CBS domain-containing protein